MTVEAILNKKGSDVVTVGADETIGGTARLLADRRIGAVVVVDWAGKIVGMLSERDIVRGVAIGGAAALDNPVRELMTARVHTCRRADPVDDIMELMTQRRIRHIPVVEEGRLVGLVSIGDVVKQRIDDALAETEDLKRYIVAG